MSSTPNDEFESNLEDSSTPSHASPESGPEAGEAETLGAESVEAGVDDHASDPSQSPSFSEAIDEHLFNDGGSEPRHYAHTPHDTSSKEKTDSPVFSPAVVANDFDPSLIRRIKEQIYSYNVHTFRPFESHHLPHTPPSEEEYSYPESIHSREAITGRYAPIGGELRDDDEYGSTFSPLDAYGEDFSGDNSIYVNDVVSLISSNLSEASETARTAPDPHLSEQWNEGRYTHEALQDKLDTAEKEREETASLIHGHGETSEASEETDSESSDAPSDFEHQDPTLEAIEIVHPDDLEQRSDEIADTVRASSLDDQVSEAKVTDEYERAHDIPHEDLSVDPSELIDEFGSDQTAEQVEKSEVEQLVDDCLLEAESEASTYDPHPPLDPTDPNTEDLSSEQEEGVEGEETELSSPDSQESEEQQEVESVDEEDENNSDLETEEDESLIEPQKIVEVVKAKKHRRKGFELGGPQLPSEPVEFDDTAQIVENLVVDHDSPTPSSELPAEEGEPEDTGEFYSFDSPEYSSEESSMEEDSDFSSDKTMQLEAVTFIDESAVPEGAAGVQTVPPSEHYLPPRHPKRASDPAHTTPVPNVSGPPPKHRPLPKLSDSVVAAAAGTAHAPHLQSPLPGGNVPPVRRTTPSQGTPANVVRPAGPPPKRRTEEIPSVPVERRPPPRNRADQPQRQSGPRRLPPTVAASVVAGPPPNRPPSRSDVPHVPQQAVKPTHSHPQGPPHQASAPAVKSSGDPQMDEIIQQLIDENNQKEVASTSDPANPTAANRTRPEWFTNYFNDDYLRSISPKQQQRTKREIEFMLRSLRPSPGASILDAACGYGRHSLEFAQRGYEVVGVDLSMTMLKRALNESNKRSAQLKKNLSVRFMQGDMRDIDYQSEFDCALLWQDSLGYFDNLGDADALKKIFLSLKPGGRFLVDTINRDYIVSLLPTRRIWFGVQAEIHEEVFFDSQTSVLFMKRTYLTNNRGIVRDYLSRIRLYSLHELLNLLRYIGFNILEVSGDILYRGHHLDHTSPRNIVLCERPKQK